jgi:glycerate kinase
LDRGCRKIIVGIGGSATVDGGAGMAQALGAKLLDKRGNEVSLGGGSLEKIVDINMEKFDARIAGIEVIVASDVDNPLCGSEGAAKVYGPQKGATPEMVDILDRNLAHFARMIKKFLGKEVADIPGAGAAGGLGAGLIAFLGAKLEPGIDLMIDASNLEEKLKGADLVISGEGRIDEQTAYGKTPMGVAERAKKENIPVILIGGEIRIGGKILYEKGVDALISSVDRVSSLSEVMKNSRRALMEASERAMRLVKIGCLLR